MFFFIHFNSRRGATSQNSFGIYMAFPIHSLKNFSNPLVMSRALALANLRVSMESIIEYTELSKIPLLTSH